MLIVIFWFFVFFPLIWILLLQIFALWLEIWFVQVCKKKNHVLGSFSIEKIVAIYYNRQIGPKIVGYVLSHGIYHKLL
jgi:hypothetical protein